MDLLSTLLSGMTSEGSMTSLTQKTGGSSDQISGLLTSALPMLMQAVGNNASTQEGAQSLLGALQQHTSTASVADQIKDADVDDGMKILGHILGANKDAVFGQLSGQSGLSTDQVGSVLGNIAPALMSGLSSSMTSAAGSIGKVDLSDGIDMKDVAGLLGTVLGGSMTGGSSGKGGLGSILGALSSFLK